MKANELMVGNLYDQFGNITKASWVTIKDLESAPPDQLWCKPIPLSKAVLDSIDWGGYTDLSINSYFKIDNVGHVYYCGDYTGLNVSYLHQLQNLKFAMTGEELEVKL